VREVTLLLLVVPIGMAAAVSANGGQPCGSPQVARARLEQSLKRFRPGMTFDEVRTQIQPPNVPSEYWGAPPRREAGPWLLSGRDASRLTIQDLVCDFDERDHLVSCKRWSELPEVQEIQERAFRALKTGEAMRAVVSRLCQPGSKEKRADGTVVFKYWVLRPEAEPSHLRSCPAYLTFASGRLATKELVCK